MLPLTQLRKFEFNPTNNCSCFGLFLGFGQYFQVEKKNHLIFSFLNNGLFKPLVMFNYNLKAWLLKNSTKWNQWFTGRLNHRSDKVNYSDVLPPCVNTCGNSKWAATSRLQVCIHKHKLINVNIVSPWSFCSPAADCRGGLFPLAGGSPSFAVPRALTYSAEDCS